MKICYLTAISLLVVGWIEARPQLQTQPDFFHPEPSVHDPKTPVKITLLPFYGGGRGQSLQITETADGTVMTNIVQTPTLTAVPEEISPYDLEHPELPTRHENEYGQNIKNIHSTALNIIRLQDAAKKAGGLSSRDEAAYKEYVDSLNQSAHNLAMLHGGDDSEEIDQHAVHRTGLSQWFARKKSSSKKDKKKEEEEKKKKEEEDKKKKDDEEKRKKEDEEKKKKVEEEKRKKEEEEKKKNEKEKEEVEAVEEDEDSVSVSLPPDDASVAEAKPVGLAVAGIGGVAASKPIATAVVGPGGLAIARPVGTAIAGVSPDQALVPIYAEGFVVPTKTKGKGDKTKHVHSTEYLNKIISKYHQA